MQTFVLASQSPKKYYVHNDIFRYDEFISCRRCCFGLVIYYRNGIAGIRTRCLSRIATSQGLRLARRPQVVRFQFQMFECAQQCHCIDVYCGCLYIFLNEQQLATFVYY